MIKQKMKDTIFGIGIVGLTNQVLEISSTFFSIFRTEISTILSLTILIPVVSKSKKQIGLVKFFKKDINYTKFAF